MNRRESASPTAPATFETTGADRVEVSNVPAAPATSSPTLILNPQLSISSAGETALTIFAPVKGESLRISDVVEADEPEIFELLRRLPPKDTQHDLNLTAGQQERLSELGVLVPESRRPSPVRFAGSLQDPPRELIPRRARSAGKDSMRVENLSSGEGLIVNPTFRYLDERRWEQDVAGTIKGGQYFLRRGSWVWLRETNAGVPCLYRVAPEERDLLSSLSAGETPPPPSSPADETYQRLLGAGILVAAGSLERWRLSREDKLQAARRQFRKSLYTVMRDLIHPFQVAALRQYYRQMIAEGYLSWGDAQVPLRYVAQNEALSRFLHGQLAGLVSRVVGEEVKPSYVYFASYRPGAILHPHTDREQCEFSLALLVDYVPEPEDVSPWPLFLQERGQAGQGIPITLGLGDGLIYKGRELIHYRHALPEGHSSSSFFFHYVRPDFDGSLH